MAQNCLLVGDIGGTNARFALANTTHPGFHDVVELKCADFRTPADAIRRYLDHTGADTPEAMCLAAAGPIVDGSIRMTNNHWTVSTAALAAEFDVDAVRLLNDFEAIACSLPFLGSEDRLVLGSNQGVDLADRPFSVAVLGPGTGLGVAGLRGRDGALVPIIGEGGHVGFAPETDLQMEILVALRSRFDRVSAERLVAGSGIENIHTALVEIRRSAEPQLTAPEIFAAAASGTSLTAREAVDVFFEILGQVAGDVVLTLGAFDGVYIAGGIARRYPDVLAAGRFRTAFDRKGRHRRLMERTPTFLVMHEQPGLLGASYVAQQLALSHG